MFLEAEVSPSNEAQLLKIKIEWLLTAGKFLIENKMMVNRNNKQVYYLNQITRYIPELVGVEPMNTRDRLSSSKNDTRNGLAQIKDPKRALLEAVADSSRLKSLLERNTACRQYPIMLVQKNSANEILFESVSVYNSQLRRDLIRSTLHYIITCFLDIDPNFIPVILKKPDVVNAIHSISRQAFDKLLCAAKAAKNTEVIDLLAQYCKKTRVTAKIVPVINLQSQWRSAIQSRDIPGLIAFIENGSEIDWTEPLGENRQNILHWAVDQNADLLIDMLLRHTRYFCCLFDLLNRYRKTALEYAVEKKSDTMVYAFVCKIIHQKRTDLFLYYWPVVRPILSGEQKEALFLQAIQVLQGMEEDARQYEYMIKSLSSSCDTQYGITQDNHLIYIARTENYPSDWVPTDGKQWIQHNGNCLFTEQRTYVTEQSQNIVNVQNN